MLARGILIVRKHMYVEICGRLLTIGLVSGHPRVTTRYVDLQPQQGI